MALNQIHNTTTCLAEDCCKELENKDVGGTLYEFKFKDISMIAGDFTNFFLFIAFQFYYYFFFYFRKLCLGHCVFWHTFQRYYDTSPILPCPYQKTYYDAIHHIPSLFRLFIQYQRFTNFGHQIHFAVSMIFSALSGKLIAKFQILRGSRKIVAER